MEDWTFIDIIMENRILTLVSYKAKHGYSSWTDSFFSYTNNLMTILYFLILVPVYCVVGLSLLVVAFPFMAIEKVKESLNQAK